jgi:cytochrome b involved in lipid metabolism
MNSYLWQATTSFLGAKKTLKDALVAEVKKGLQGKAKLVDDTFDVIDVSVDINSEVPMTVATVEYVICIGEVYGRILAELIIHQDGIIGNIGVWETDK